MKTYLSFFAITSILLFSNACSPRVEVEVPDKPITINLNVKVEHEIKVQIDKELDSLFEEEEENF